MIIFGWQPAFLVFQSQERLDWSLSCYRKCDRSSADPELEQNYSSKRGRLLKNPRIKDGVMLCRSIVPLKSLGGTGGEIFGISAGV